MVGVEERRGREGRVESARGCAVRVGVWFGLGRGELGMWWGVSVASQTLRRGVPRGAVLGVGVHRCSRAGGSCLGSWDRAVAVLGRLFSSVLDACDLEP